VLCNADFAVDISPAQPKLKRLSLA